MRRGLRVYTVHNRYAIGEPLEYIVGQYEVPPAAILEALAYAADHTEEMEAMRRADAEAPRWVIDRMPEQVREIVRHGAEEDEEDFRRRVERARMGRLGSPLP